MFPRKFTLAEAAEVVRNAAKKGRQNARDGINTSAEAFMYALGEAAKSDNYPESLRTVALSAATDINKMLSRHRLGLPLEEGSAA